VTCAIWWVRRDLRLTDNQALAAAIAHGDSVVPVFVLDPALLASSFVGARRVAFLFDGLRQLDESLRARGSRLIVRRGEPLGVLTALVRACSADVIYAEEDYSPYARRRDQQIADHLPLRLVGGLTVHPPKAVVKPDGQPYVVFTPFSRAWLALPPPDERVLLPAPARIHTPMDIGSEPVPAVSSADHHPSFPAGEVEAHRRLAAFTAGPQAPIYAYADQRNRMDRAATSQLSPYLRFGMLSARQAAVAARRALETAPDAGARQGAAAWLNELIWREFYIAVLAHFPAVRRRAFRSDLQTIPWLNDTSAFERWCAGRTGYPVVDAAMRQLAETGWMHNRARMIVASFLVKDLLIDWRWGERWFMRQLLDGDPAANNGGWQWTAGTGTDAAPYFRIFNPVSQGIKFDPDGEYVRHWVTELASVPRSYIHAPWEMPADVQRAARCVVGDDYPAPLVDHQAARARTLAAYAAARARG
jgi:deoxyribodipyrimidine photo-lyase